MVKLIKLDILTKAHVSSLYNRQEINKMINTHYSIFRWGTAQMWWTGTFEELKFFKEWVEQHVPKKDFDWFNMRQDKFDESHLSGRFRVNAWTFLINWWSNGKLGTSKWELVNGNPYYKAGIEHAIGIEKGSN